MTLYPMHHEDSGPLIPTTDGGVICGRCHAVQHEPMAHVYAQAYRAHRESGCEPVLVTKRPPPERLTVADLNASERKALVTLDKGYLNRISERPFAALLVLGLVSMKQEHDPKAMRGVKVTREATEHGKRLGSECAKAAAAAVATTEPMFDLGPPDPAAEHRLALRKVAIGRR